MTIILKDETTYEIIGFEEGVSITMQCADQATVMTAWADLTDDNLEDFIIEEYGTRTRYWNYKVKGLLTNSEDGSEQVTARFLVKHTELSQEYEMIRQLEATTERSFENVTRDREQTDQAVQALNATIQTLTQANATLAGQISTLAEEKEMLEECLLEMSELVYA